MTFLEALQRYLSEYKLNLDDIETVICGEYELTLEQFKTLASKDERCYLGIEASDNLQIYTKDYVITKVYTEYYQDGGDTPCLEDHWVIVNRNPKPSKKLITIGDSWDEETCEFEAVVLKCLEKNRKDLYIHREKPYIESSRKVTLFDWQAGEPIMYHIDFTNKPTIRVTYRGSLYTVNGELLAKGNRKEKHELYLYDSTRLGLKRFIEDVSRELNITLKSDTVY